MATRHTISATKTWVGDAATLKRLVALKEVSHAIAPMILRASQNAGKQPTHRISKCAGGLPTRRSAADSATVERIATTTASRDHLALSDSGDGTTTITDA